MGLAAAMVLAAGRGTRMQPLTRVLPKPALPVLHRPLVAWALDQAVAAGAPRVVVNSWHLAPALEAVLERLGGEVPLAVSREHELMDTAGGLALARERGLLGREGPVLVLNGDGLYGLDLRPVLERHLEGQEDVTLALLPHLDPARWARVLLDSAGRVREILPPGPPAPGEVPLLYPGAMMLSRRALEALPVEPAGIPERLWRPAMASGRMGGVVVAGHWREVGTPRAYLEAVLERLGERSWVAPDARVAGGAVVGRSMVGARSRVAPSAVVAESILAEGAEVEPGARVIRSVLLGPVRIPSGRTASEEVLAESL